MHRIMLALAVLASLALSRVANAEDLKPEDFRGCWQYVLKERPMTWVTYCFQKDGSAYFEGADEGMVSPFCSDDWHIEPDGTIVVGNRRHRVTSRTPDSITLAGVDGGTYKRCTGACYLEDEKRKCHKGAKKEQ